MRRSSVPVSITPLILPQLPITRQGLTPFTFSRFLVPWLCDYEGHAIFMDADMLCLGDVAELAAVAENMGAGSVACRPFEAIVNGKDCRFEKASLMVFNNAMCERLTPEFIDDEHNNPLDMAWANEIAHIPDNWNRLVGYEDTSDAKLLHYTAGIPAYQQVCKPGWRAEDWQQEYQLMTAVAPYEALMGNSVHVQNLGIDLNGAGPQPSIHDKQDAMSEAAHG